MNSPSIDALRIKIFADGADLATIRRLSLDPRIKGFTTNPSLMRAAGVRDYREFGRRLPNHPGPRVVQGDIRDTARLAASLLGQDAVLHLACISNDASFELDENLSKAINYVGFENHSIADLATTVKSIDKVRRVLGYAPTRTIEDAMRDRVRAFVNHLLPDSFDNDWYYNVRAMKQIEAR